MSTIQDPSPEINNRPNFPLVLLIRDQQIDFDPTWFREHQVCEQFSQVCSAAATPIVMINNMIDWSDDDRWSILRLIAGIPNARFRAAEAEQDTDLFEAVLALMLDDRDVERCGRGRRAAIQAAALVHAGDVESAASRIAGRLSDLHVRGGHVATIRSDIRKLATSLRHMQNPDQTPQLRVRDVFDDAPVPDAAIIPPGWRCDAAGISRLDDSDPTNVVPSPVYLSQRLTNIDNGGECVELCFVRDGRWKTKMVNRAAIASARTIVEHANDGLPVTTNNAAVLVQFLFEFEVVNIETLPVARVTGRLGWIGENGRDGFLCGNTLITGNANAGDEASTIRFVGGDAGEDQVAAGFHAAGTLAGWQQAVQPLATYPRAKFGIYSALCTPLLEIFRAENFVVSYNGPTSLGKTSVLRIIASAAGCPNEGRPGAAMHSWDATRFFLESAAALQNHLPFVVDDTKRAKWKEDISRMIYDIAGGRGRERGSTTGVQLSKTYSTVMITSGEEQITSFSEDGGTRARVLEFWGSPFDHADAATGQTVNALNAGVRENFGHALPAFVQFIIQHRDQWPAWRDEYREQCEILERRAGDDPVAGRLAKHMALIEMAAILAHRAEILPWDYCNITGDLWAELAAETLEADRAVVALQHVLSWANSHAHEFFGRQPGSQDPPFQGRAGRWDRDENGCRWQWLGFYPHRLDEILVAKGFNPKAIIKMWHDRGWLRVTGNRLQFRTRIGNDSPWLVAIERAAIEQVEGVWGDPPIPRQPLVRGIALPTLGSNGHGAGTSANGNGSPSAAPPAP